jgi:dihydrofolate reductase
VGAGHKRLASPVGALYLEGPPQPTGARFVLQRRGSAQSVLENMGSRSDDPGVTLVAGDPVGLVRRLKREPGLDIWLCGGGHLAGQLLPELDELVLKQYPVIAGAGIPLFAGEFRPRGFDLADTTRFANGSLVLRYTPLP